MFETINHNISKYISFTREEISLFNNLLEKKECRKKTLLLKEGEICRFEAFVVKGCIRSYYIDEKGAEVILQFAVENWWISDIASFHEQKPSRMFIETLEDCELLLLTPEKKEILLREAPCFERMFRLLLQRNIATLQERVFHTISLSATEKYLDFLARYPELPNRVAQHYIAAYLGFTPEFLSKVRTRLAKQ